MGKKMLNGYCIIAKDYNAEIVEFSTLSIITMPDMSKLYFIHTKYGDDYKHEKELSPTREELEKECKELNESFQRVKKGAGDKHGKSVYKPRQHW